MLIKILAISLALLSLLPINEGLRTLVVFPMMSRSHSILGHGVVTHLLEAGHQVVHVTSYPREKPVSNLTEIDVSSIGQRFRTQADKFDAFKLQNLVGKNNIGDSLLFMFFAYDYHKQFLEDENVVKLLSDPKEKFDVVVLEWFFSEFIAGIAPLFQCPLIWVGSTEAHWQILRIVDEIPNSAYSVELFSTSRPPLSFWERAWELWKMLRKYVLLNTLVVPFEKYNYNKVYMPIAAKRGVAMPSYDEAVYNGSLLLINSHPSIGTPFKLPQNAKYIAGFHIDRNPTPLPKVLEKIMNESKHGVIYFSMGSNLRSAEMSTEMKESLLALFSKLKQTVIWKFEEDLNNLPSNVHLVKWAPQLSILSHPKLKLFITHGGFLSTIEAVYFGVPLIGIPVLGDQHVNMRSVEEKGYGIMVKLTEDLATHLQVALSEMLRDPSYDTKAKELSLVYHDRVVPPGVELVHWVEHVARTRGAAHLRSPALHVPWYQKMYLDLIAVTALIMILLHYIYMFVLEKLKKKKPISKKDKKDKRN